MTGITTGLLFLAWFSHSKAQEHLSQDLYTLVEKGQGGSTPDLTGPTNPSRAPLKEPLPPINEPLEKSSRAGDAKYSLQPLPLWPKHSDPAVPVARPHAPPGKAKKGPRGAAEGRQAVEHNGDKARGEAASAGLLPKAALVSSPGLAVAAVSTNHTLPKAHLDAHLHHHHHPHLHHLHQPHLHQPHLHQPHLHPPHLHQPHLHQPHLHQPHLHQPHHGEPAEGYPNFRARGAQHHSQKPQAGPSHNAPSPPRRDPPPPPPPHRLDAEENRPAKASVHQAGVGAAAGLNASRSLLQRGPSGLQLQFDVLKRESDFTHDAFCLSECRKEREEREHHCHSEFAVNGVVHDIDTVWKGIRVVTLMVGSDGFYKTSRLYASPDSFFFKVRLLVLDTYRCSRPCPDLKLGSRYIVMGHIYHRRRNLPNDLLTLLGGRLKPGDGLLWSSSYVKRFNKRRHLKALAAARSRCR